MDVSLTQQIKEVQQQLRRQAQLLGQLNLKNNDYLQQNQKLALSIAQLRNKIAKKKHIIEQENKDKMIIHEKLIKAQREKELLEIQQRHRKQQQVAKKNHERQEMQKVKKEMNAINAQQEKQASVVSKELVKERQSLTPQRLPEYKLQQKPQQKPQIEQPVTHPTSQEQKPSQSKSEANEHYAEETDRGQYQPPILFLETDHNSEKSESQDSSDEDMDEEMLAKLKSAAQDEEQNDDDDD